MLSVVSVAVTSLRRPRVLVIEHDRAVRTMQAYILNEAGYEVLEASNGFSGLRLARTAQPNAIVLDLVLPELPGCALMEVLRTEPCTLEVPLIVVSAYAEGADPRIGKWAHAMLSKPFSVAELLHCVGSALAATSCPESQRRSRREVRRASLAEGRKPLEHIWSAEPKELQS